MPATLSGHDFVVTDLGVVGAPTAFSSSMARDINASGTVVGESSTPGSPTLAFIWTPQGGMASLGLASPTDAYSRANAINDAGWIAGESGSRPVLWKPGQPPIYLELTGLRGAALDINNAGVVTGTYDVATVTRSFRWENGEFRDLGSLGGDRSRALGINNLGKIVGGATNSATFVEHAVIWDPVGGWVSLGVVEALNARRAAARSINTQGEIVGFYFPQSGQVSPFVFRPGIGAAPLAPNNPEGGDANAINDAGQIVGSVGSDAVLWDPAAGMVRLFTLGGQVGHANSINGSNQIVGYSQVASGREHATLWQLKTNVAPVARLDGPATGMKKKPLVFSAERSTDADSDALTFSWDFGDGTATVTGARVTHEFNDWGSYAVTLTVRDTNGNSASASATVLIASPGQLKHQ